MVDNHTLVIRGLSGYRTLRTTRRVPHGECSTYNNRGCRCTLCCVAQSAYKRSMYVTEVKTA